MEPTIFSFIIVCPLVFLASFVDAIAGGGGLISLPAYLWQAYRFIMQLQQIKCHPHVEL